MCGTDGAAGATLEPLYLTRDSWIPAFAGKTMERTAGWQWACEFRQPQHSHRAAVALLCRCKVKGVMRGTDGGAGATLEPLYLTRDSWIPAFAGKTLERTRDSWIPAFAGKTMERRLQAADWPKDALRRGITPGD